MTRSKHGVCTFLVLDLGLDVVDGVAALDLKRDGLPRQRLHEDLHLASLSLSLSLSPLLGLRPRRGMVVVVTVGRRARRASELHYIEGRKRGGYETPVSRKVEWSSCSCQSRARGKR
jgi:hypothetical protein